MKVIKLGGSLMDDAALLTHCLNTIEKKNKGKVVVVPGGGIFADQVRSVQKQWGFDDNIAHQMAILAMQQMALLYKSGTQSFFLAENISAMQQAFVNHSVVIWSPDIRELNLAGVKPSWDITSDSLSAWLANQLMASELILIKAAEIPLELSIQEMQNQGLLDRAFNEFIKNSSYKITLINRHRFNEYAFT